MTQIPTLTVRAARRLAIARAGLLGPHREPSPSVDGLTPAMPGPPPVGEAPRIRAPERRQRDAALAVIRRFGYLQLDTVAIAGARSHAIVLLSRLERFPATLAEELLQPGEPLFEFWGHEASWLPGELYPAFAFRRRDGHPWHPETLANERTDADALLRRIADEGPLRSVDLEGASGTGWWDLKKSKIVANALWSAGELAIRERRGFVRTYDLTERVIPEAWRARPLSERDSVRLLLEQALAGFGWATTGTLAATWRLRNCRPLIEAVLAELVDAGSIVACDLAADASGPRVRGWIRPADLELAARLETLRLRADRGVLLSPFDPLLWDRGRVARLFGFDAILEIFKPAPERRYGYYCLPVLAGDRLVARLDLAADRRRGRLAVLAHHPEELPAAAARAAARATATALARYADAVVLAVDAG